MRILRTPLLDADTKYARKPKKPAPFGYSVERAHWSGNGANSGWQWIGRRTSYWYATAAARDQAAAAMRKNRMFEGNGSLVLYRDLRLEERS